MDDPWFTYFRGRGRMQITPRNAKGWAAVVVFVVLITLPALALEWAIARSPWLIVPFVAVMLLLTIAFVRFSISKSERLDLNMTAAELDEFRRWKKRGKR